MYLVYSLSVITVLLKEQGIVPIYSPNSNKNDQDRKPLSDDYCKNFFDMIKVIEKKAAANIFEYEFYKKFKAVVTYEEGGELPKQDLFLPERGHAPNVNENNVEAVFNEDCRSVRASMVKNIALN